MDNKVLVIPEVGAIKCDFEAVENYIQSRCDEYKGVLFTEDTKKDAKATVAQLRKEKEEFKNEIKRAKAEYMKPFDEFYAKASELVNRFDKPISFINEQIEDFENKRIEEKINLIYDLYKEFIEDHDLAKFIPLHKIYNPRWENATFTPNQISKELIEKRDKVVDDLNAIHSLGCSDVEDKAISMYLESFDISSTILFVTNYQKEKAEILEREKARLKAEEEERIRREERAKIEAELKAEAEKQKAIEEAKAEVVGEIYEEAKAEAKAEAIEAFLPDLEGDSDLYEYRVSLTTDAKEKLEMFLDSVGIEWEIING